MKNATTENKTLLSLYINGKYCECNVHSLPFLKGTVLMIPLHVAAKELGFQIEHHHDLGYDLVYRESIFEKNALTVRFVKSGGAAQPVTYYYQSGKFIELPPVELIGDEIFVPMELLTAALNCTCHASPSGNINVRYVVPAGTEPRVKMLSETDTLI